MKTFEQAVEEAKTMNKSQAVMNVRSNKMMAAFMRGNENYRGAQELIDEIRAMTEVHGLTDSAIDKWDATMLEYQKLRDQRADLYESGDSDTRFAADAVLHHFRQEHNFNNIDYDWWRKNMQKDTSPSGTRPVDQYSGSQQVSRKVDQAMESLGLRFGQGV